MGHPNYWAPEFGTKKGYTVLADLWALGICLFEMTTGYFPFGDETDDTYELLSKISHDPLEFPEDIFSQPNYFHLKSFISQLLSKNARDRLGPGWSKIRGDYACLKNHNYLKNFPCKKVAKMEGSDLPPLRPKSSQITDNSDIISIQEMTKNPLKEPEDSFAGKRVKNQNLFNKIITEFNFKN